jgi:hypothetical protein
MQCPKEKEQTSIQNNTQKNKDRARRTSQKPARYLTLSLQRLQYFSKANWIYIMLQQYTDRHVSPLEHIILIPSKPVFALSP